MRRPLAVLAALVPLVTSAPATAEETVGVLFNYDGVRLGAGGVAVVECFAAMERPLAATDIALRTNVTCSVGGLATTATFPGPAAVTTTVNVVAVPFEICVTGWASFFDPATKRVYVASDQLCATLTTIS